MPADVVLRAARDGEREALAQLGHHTYRTSGDAEWWQRYYREHTHFAPEDVVPTETAKTQQPKVHKNLKAKRLAAATAKKRAPAAAPKRRAAAAKRSTPAVSRRRKAG